MPMLMLISRAETPLVFRSFESRNPKFAKSIQYTTSQVLYSSEAAFSVDIGREICISRECKVVLPGFPPLRAASVFFKRGIAAVVLFLGFLREKACWEFVAALVIGNAGAAFSPS